MHENRTHPNPGGSDSNPTWNFIIPEWGLVSKPKRPDIRKNRSIPEWVPKRLCLGSNPKPYQIISSREQSNGRDSKMGVEKSIILDVLD